VRRLVPIALSVCLLALSACGKKDLDPDTYTCGQWNKSLRTKDDLSSGTFIRALRERAKLGQARAVEEREFAVAIFFACRGKPSSYKPAGKAIENAKALKAGKKLGPKAKAKAKRKSASKPAAK
jgi:hypothetical protein